MISIYFGNPGCGKTTFACRLLKKAAKHVNVYSNFETPLAFYVSSLNGLGNWTIPPHSFFVIDEAGIEYNSRKYKSLSQSTIQWFKFHRHYRCDLAVLSQSWEDMDITLRRLADELWYLRRFGPFTFARRVFKKIDIDKQTHQIIDSYRFGSLLSKSNWSLTFRPLYYRFFDSYSTPPTPVRYFEYPSFELKKSRLQRIGFFLKSKCFRLLSAIGKRFGVDARQ